MGFFQFVQRALGWGGASAPPLRAPTPPLTSRPQRATSPVLAPRLASPPGSPVVATHGGGSDLGAMLMREEMLDQRGRLAGHRISVQRSNATGHGWHAAREYLHALQTSQVQRQAERRVVLIDVPHDALTGWQDADWLSLIQQHTVFQIPTHVTELHAVRRLGAGAALNWTGATPEPVSLWPTLSHVVLSLKQDPLQVVEQRLLHLRHTQPHLQIIVRDVATWAEQRLCVSQGAHLTMGPFLTTVDERGTHEPVAPGRLVLMDMLQALRQGADNAALADLAKRDPGIAVQLLSRVNSPAFGLSQPLSSLDQAMSLLGRDALYRWLSVSLFAGERERPQDMALLEMALTRARFMEQLGQAHGVPGQSDELFLVGLLSFVDRLLGLPLDELLERMAVPPSVADVLLRSEGPHAPWMLLALAMERCDADRLIRMAQAQGLPPGDFAHWRDEAVLWAADAVH